MNNVAITSLYVNVVNKQMPQIDADLTRLLSYAQTLLSIGEGKAIAADFFAERTRACMQCTIRIHHALEHLAESAASVSRQSLGGNRYEQFQSNFRGGLRNIQEKFDRLHDLMPQLMSLSSDKLNDPARWNDAPNPYEPITATSNIVAIIISRLDTLFELWSLERIRQKLQ